LGRRSRRCGRTARAGGGGSAPATGIARPGQQAAQEGPMEPREGAGMVARPWEVVGAQLGGGGANGAVERRCRHEGGGTCDIYIVAPCR
jgi:hypothetical protein